MTYILTSFYLAFFLTFYLACILASLLISYMTFFLASDVPGAPRLSWSRHELLAKKEGWKKEGKEEGREEGVAPLIKSRDPQKNYVSHVSWYLYVFWMCFAYLHLFNHRYNIYIYTCICI